MTTTDDLAREAIDGARAAMPTLAADAEQAITAAVAGADAPLGKPAGTVRAYLALGIVGAFVIGTAAVAVADAVHGDMAAAKDAIGVLGGLATAIVPVYFVARTASSN